MDIVGVNNRDDFISRADSYLVRELYGEALDLSRERLNICPGDTEAMMVICQAWLGLDDLEEAQAAFSALDKARLRLAGLYKGMGDAYLKRGLKHEAVSCFQKGMMIIPEAIEVRHHSQMMTDALGAFDGGDAQGDGEAEDGGHAVSPDFYTLTMADLYMKQGHPDMAADVLEAILRREPDNETVKARLYEIRPPMGNPSGTPSPELPSAFLGELSRWLNNIDRIRSPQCRP